ncbi:hypothetical protein GJ699_02030 [Duganella sp. FT80W]|uniref:DUF1640 domain-containing protein n=1 Tax=Duganella guangzhouensis TaxID=2666084 RepID=A0A6I2KTU3_9BURK|nr:hypothetical protein [Duganella guangzhouensis]MRW88760.1 hypothetical protein [Duganella guangzhouensis]
MANNLDMNAFVDTLVAGDFSQKQATTLAAALVTLIDAHMVTREYLDMRLNELRLEFRADLANLKADLIQWICGLLIAQAGVTAVLFKLLH